MGNPHLLYANLAVRGRRIAEVHDEQLPRALELEPDLVSIIAGINDVLRPRFDLDATLAHMEEMQREVRARGTTVVTTTFPDVSSVVPVARLLRGRLARLNAGFRAIAARRGSVLLDCEDRLHLNPDGHRHVAHAIAAALGVTESDTTWPTAVPSAPRDGALQRVEDELRWAQTFLLPWIGRRLTGRSSGDGQHPKRPQLRSMEPGAFRRD